MQLLDLIGSSQFYRTHDASHYNHQGPDRGTQYRSAIFYFNDDQREVAEKVTKEVEEKHYKPKGKNIVTVIEKFEQWWDAEDYHQNCSCHFSCRFYPQ
jgi:peptide-methionine (S)-S-oxide reductase